MVYVENHVTVSTVLTQVLLVVVNIISPLTNINNIEVTRGYYVI